MPSKWSIEDFLSQYSSTNTTNVYRSIFKDYFKLFYPDLKGLNNKQLYKKLPDISLDYINQDRDFRKDLMKYKQHISHQAPKTISTKIACILRYFESNQNNFNDNFTRNLYGTGSGEAISEEKVPTNEEIARILEYLPIHAKALTLLLASSGIRIGEAMKLTWNDIDLESQPVKINLRAEYTKTKKKRITFISKEAENILREFIDYIPKYIDKNEGYKTRIDKDFKGKVFPFSATTFRKLWNGALKDAGLYEQDPKTNRVSLRPHNLRKFFRTYGKWRNPDIAEALMGHISGLKAIYARLDQAEEILLEGYLEAEPNLSIYHNSKTILELREKVDKQSEDIQELVTNLSLKNVRLENRLEEQQVKLEGTIETNQKLLETIITQGSLMENMQSQLNILSKRVFDRNKVEAKERLKKFEKEDIVRMTNEDGVVKFQIKSI